MIKKVLVLGGGSAGFLAALALKVKLPQLQVDLIHSKDLGIIGVGEGSTLGLTDFLHKYLGISVRKFFATAFSLHLLQSSVAREGRWVAQAKGVLLLGRDAG